MNRHNVLVIEQEGNKMETEQKKRGRIIAPTTLRVRRYRQQHPRIDYFPSPDVMDIIKHHLATSEPCIAGVLDGLIRMGHKAVSGNGGKQ